MNKHVIDIISYYLKKMMRFENEFSSDSGLILSETLYEKKMGNCFGRLRDRGI